MISPGLCPGHLYDVRSYVTPRSCTLPWRTTRNAARREASVISFSAPTSSFLPHTQPQPWPFFHFCVAGDSAAAARSTNTTKTEERSNNRNDGLIILMTFLLEPVVKS